MDDAAGIDVVTGRRMRFPPPTGGPGLPPPAPGRSPPLPPRGQSAADAGWARMVFPPRLEKITGSVDFNEQADNVALGAAVGATAAGPLFRLPENQVGWLQQIWLFVLNQVVGTRIQLSVLINGGPIPGFDDIRNFQGVANIEIIPANDCRVGLPMGGLIETRFTNLGGGAFTVGAKIAGWYHPLASEAQEWGVSAR